MNQDNIINTSQNTGQFRCPDCNSSDITYDSNLGKLKCNYCGLVFENKQLVGVETNLNNLTGTIRGVGTTNISNSQPFVSIKCGNCGAEVVIDTSNINARCHWCRSVLSMDNKIDNGMVPDMILPFKASKEEAKEEIERFVKKRKMFANKQFKKEFSIDNIIGVYFPYIVVDANAHACFDGDGEHLVRKYNVGSDEHKKYKYDADAYLIKRSFDITISDLTVEANSKRLDNKNINLTNNIINSIMPFDIENCVQFQPNYLVGFSSEVRDLNIEEMNDFVNARLKDIARFSALDSEDRKLYNRGVHWREETFDIKGSQWLSAYLPVWLYSYREVNNNNATIHYVAINGRTKEVMGSIPINNRLVKIVSILLPTFLILIYFFISVFLMEESGHNFLIYFALFMSGVIFNSNINSMYRNYGARHSYEIETKKEITNLVKEDKAIGRLKGIDNSYVNGCNDDKLDGENISFSKK